MLVACGGSLVTIAELPVYPDAKELAAGESAIGNTLQKNMSQDAALRQTAGAGGKTEQRGFTLPADASWEKVNAFYTEKLKAAGWAEGLGGPGGNIASEMLKTVNESNDAFQTGMFSKGI